MLRPFVYSLRKNELHNRSMHISGMFKKANIESLKTNIEDVEADIETQKADIKRCFIFSKKKAWNKEAQNEYSSFCFAWR